MTSPEGPSLISSSIHLHSCYHAASNGVGCFVFFTSLFSPLLAGGSDQRQGPRVRALPELQATPGSITVITGSRSSPGPQMALRSTYCISSPSWTQRVNWRLVSFGADLR